MAIPEPEFIITSFQLIQMLKEIEIKNPSTFEELREYNNYLKTIMYEHLDIIYK